jgi:type IV pilus assembly protein PilW
MRTLIFRAGLRVRSFGFSLVELMVAIVIGMLSMLVVLQVFTTFEEQKRVSTGGSESLEHGAIALNMLAARIGQAGFGMMVPNTLDCLVRGSNEPLLAAGADVDYQFRLRPVFITQGANGAPDRVSIIFGSSPMILGGAALVEDQDGTAAEFKVTDTYGFSPRNKFIVAQPYSGSGVRKDCTLREATEVTQTSPFVIKHVSRFNYTDNKQPEKSKNNKSGGSSVAYNRGAKIYNFGTLASPVFSINNGALLLGSSMAAEADWQLLLDNVVSLQAQYGFDTRAESARNGTLVVDTFSEAFLDADGDAANIDSVNGDADDWLRLGALRIGLVVRTSQAEMAASRNVADCTATTNNTITFPWAYRDASDTNKASLTVNIEDGRADWRCYRYKAFETVVALRNIKWNLPK